MNEEKDFQTKRMNMLLEEIKGEFRSVSEGHKAMVKKFNEMETKVNDRLERVELKLDVVKADVTGRMNQSEKRMEDKMDHLGKRMEDKMDHLEKSVENKLEQQAKDIRIALDNSGQKYEQRLISLERR